MASATLLLVYIDISINCPFGRPCHTFCLHYSSVDQAWELYTCSVDQRHISEVNKTGLCLVTAFPLGLMFGLQKELAA